MRPLSKVLFFSPFANIWEHTLPEGLLAGYFQGRGVDVVTVRCDTMFQAHCVAMSAAGVGPEAPLRTRQRVCSACIKRRDFATEQLGLPAVILDAWLRPEDHERTDALLSSVGPGSWTGLEVDGIALGRYAAYEFWLTNKLTSTDLDPLLWTQYLGQLRNTLLAYFAGRRLLEADPPDAVLVYNDHYSVNHAFIAAAEGLGIPGFAMHGGNHLTRRAQRLTVLGTGVTLADIIRSEPWAKAAGAPLNAAEMALVGEHISGLLDGSSAFAYSSRFEGSAPSDLRGRLGIRPGSPVLLAATSSEDEQLALELIDAAGPGLERTSVFASQLDWIEHLLGYARAHAEVHVIVRMHPRMFPNKREGVLAPAAAQFLALRATAPSNVSFNVPSDGIGLYDVMQVVDVLVNYRSTVGAELAAFGIPVVAPANREFATYPAELHRVGRTVHEYEEHIGEAIREGWSIERTRLAFRWYAFWLGRVAVGITDGTISTSSSLRPKKPGLRLWLWRRMVYLVLQYGPLVRERLSVRHRTISEPAMAILFDVVERGLPSPVHSRLWSHSRTTSAQETDLLAAYLLSVANTLWGHITEPDSLAGRIRTGLAVPS